MTQDKEIQYLLMDKKPNWKALRDHITTKKNKRFQKKAKNAEQYSQEKNQHEIYTSVF